MGRDRRMAGDAEVSADPHNYAAAVAALRQAVTRRHLGAAWTGRYSVGSRPTRILAWPGPSTRPGRARPPNRK